MDEPAGVLSWANFVMNLGALGILAVFFLRIMPNLIDRILAWNEKQLAAYQEVNAANNKTYLEMNAANNKEYNERLMNVIKAYDDVCQYRRPP